MQASAAINELRGAVDTLIVVANDRLLEVAGAGIPLERAFSVADDILRQVNNPRPPRVPFALRKRVGRDRAVKGAVGS